MNVRQSKSADPDGANHRPRLGHHGDAVRIFSSASDAPNARRPTDLVLLLTSFLGLVLATLAASGSAPLGETVTGALRTLLASGGWFWQICYDVLLAWALVLVVVALAAHRRRRLLGTQLLAAVISLGSIVVAAEAAGTTWSDALAGIWRAGTGSIYPASRLALACAVIVAASPHLSRPLRFLGRWTLFFGATATVALGSAEVVGVIAGFLVGVGSAAIAHLLLGSPGGRLSLAQVDAALRDLGVDARDLRHAPLQPSGVALVEATDTAGRSLLVKVYGRDAWDGQLITSTWTALTQRGQTPHTGSRSQQVEHEAFVTLFAERAGVRVMPLIAAGLARGRDALLVTRNEGRTLSSVDPTTIDDGLLARLWDVALGLDAQSIGHGSLDADHFVVVPDGTAAVTGFREAMIGAPDLTRATDRAQLLVAIALLVGEERSVAAALAALGPEGLAAILPCIQPAILDRESRHLVRQQEWDLDDLRVLAATAAGVGSPALEQLHRVTWGSLLKVALIAFVAYVIISAVAQVGLQSLIDSFASADPWWLLGALLLAPAVQVPQAFSTIGASIQPVRYVPALMLQYAIQFIQLAVPSSAGRIALSIRFFQRNGVTAVGAMTISAIDAVSGFLVQIVLILTVVFSGLASLNVSTETSTASSDDHPIATLLLLIVVVVAVGAVVTVLVRPLRQRVAAPVSRVREALRARRVEAATSLRVLRQPSKVALSLGGNFVAQVLQAVVLGMCLAAFGQHATMAELLLINSAVSLFAGFMPVPGGMGVSEAAYTAAFVAIGVPSTEALSAAIAFRGVTYYLPPIYGAVAMRWLRRRDYL